jgi:hypothetical protein
VFHELAIHGPGGVLLYGYLEAVTLSGWLIRREIDPKRGPWVLSGAIRTRNRVWSNAKPLFFTAPRLGGGRWLWPVLDVCYSNDHVSARLGPPEH